MAWLRSWLSLGGDERLDAKILATMRANEEVEHAAAEVRGSAERNQALMENVTHDASRRAQATMERREQRRANPQMNAALDALALIRRRQ